MFALANGHIGLRANLDEGEPFGLPGTYLNAFYELRPLPYAEAGYGFPESGQTLVNVTDGKIISLLVDDEPFDLRYGELRTHERELDLRAGVLRRSVEWIRPRATQFASDRRGSSRSPSARRRRSSTRSSHSTVRCAWFSSRSSSPTSRLPAPPADPRAAVVLDSPLHSEEHSSDENRVVLVHSTKLSELRLAAAWTTWSKARTARRRRRESRARRRPGDDRGRSRVGQRLRVVKFLAYGCSSQRSCRP